MEGALMKSPLLFSIGSSLCLLATAFGEPKPMNPPAREIRIALAGDSTVADYKANEPFRGWGQFIERNFKDEVRVQNYAKGGESSLSYYRGGLWYQAMSHRPDVVLIQFGQNDSHPFDADHPEAARADIEYRDTLSKLIDSARRAHARPILVTPVHPRNFDKQGQLGTELDEYAKAMRTLAEEKSVPLIDLYAASAALFAEWGPARCRKIEPVAGDYIHFNAMGARAVAGLVVSELTRVDSALAAHLYRMAAAPRVAQVTAPGPF